MKLIGMFDSPYVRRVAVTLKHLEVPFEHANWSVGADFERIREFSPLGRVPVLDDGTALVDSAAILDAIDDQVGPTAWLVDDRLTQADITVACISTFLKESRDIFGGDAPYAAPQAHVARCEALPEFRATHAPWFAAAMKS